MNHFQIKTSIHFGTDALSSLQRIENKRIFVVTDPFMIKSGMIDKVKFQLEKKNEHITIFHNIVPDPPLENIVNGIQVMSAADPDVVIALGGGSAIDAAKAICLFQNRLNQKEAITKEVTFIAVPTTSGTGSEVTSFSVVTDRTKNVKYPLVSDEMLPTEAILDPELVKTVPPFITADTGIDVLTHALEAYVSTLASDFTDAFSEKAIRLVFAYLEKSFQNGEDDLSREKMHNASCIAGLAFNAASLGISHSMAHIIGAKFHIPHGRSNGIVLPYVIEYNAHIKGYTDRNFSIAASKYAEIAKLLNLPSSDTRNGVKNLIIAVKKLRKDLGMPASLKEAGVKKEEFYKELDNLAEIAMKDKCTITNPRSPSIEDLKNLFEQAYLGN
ncbi:1-propanol dehydrogenase PduQ [Brevibacillus laterosporus]|uniref:1-propanol dehydrogenase PduQ n=1 Tax=Brevibacillus laterosporus TaxID=1465 RepID=UPI002650F712|nr:1-propanol dehydrogenase PduQ [Brevibacillus laterosporus]MDN9010173.1 1-propanol dehydrogenase PduQ [Brevibacillus laterosporus]MDO0941427.1 1-propanol dehydrogenase PduQ [Brevibacillus laterosporus]